LQRDLSDSTTVRNIGVALAHSLLVYKGLLSGLSRVSPNIALMTQTLNEDWVILTEGVQTVLRRAGTEDPYSMIASLSRGQHIGKDEWQSWVDGLDVQNSIKAQLKELTPETYLGKAVELTELALAEIKASRHS
jgi:adenylosuccinate lyase